MKATLTKKQVSERALVQRLNRRLTKQNEQLCACRQNSRDWPDLGDYYLVDTEINGIVGKHVDLENLAKEFGVLRGYECLVAGN